MTVPSGPGWVARLDPPVPVAFAYRLGRVPGGGGELPPLDALLEGALDALHDALGDGEASRKDREDAFDLLAADGLLTYACEAALDADDPEVALRRLVAEVAAARGEPDER